MSRTKNTEVAVRAEDQSVTSIIDAAVKSNVPVETLERLFGLRQQVKAEQAKEAYIEALTHFQEACPVIKKTKQVMNKDGRTVRYTFAPLDSIVQQIKKPLKDNELSYRWDTESKDGQITATCIITHKLGHSERSSFTVATDANEYMTSPQRSASSLTFAKRYSLCNALGISTGDEDTDATDAKKEPDAKSRAARIIFRLRALGEKTGSKEEIDAAVRRLTQVEPMPKNIDEILARLQVLIDERHENPEIQ